MLYDVIYLTYCEIYNVKQIPSSLKFRLANINARSLNYNDFIKYFELEDRYEALKFIMADINYENILRYSNEHKDSVCYAKSRKIK